jgi:hypothetical protein
MEALIWPLPPVSATSLSGFSSRKQQQAERIEGEAASRSPFDQPATISVSPPEFIGENPS